MDASHPGDDAPGIPWAYWNRWRGPPELVVQIARRAVRAVGSEDAERGSVTSSIVVYVPTHYSKPRRTPRTKTTTQDDIASYEQAREADLRAARDPWVSHARAFRDLPDYDALLVAESTRYDEEVIANPEDFAETVTADALRRFSVIVIAADGPRGSIRAEISRMPTELRGSGALLTVSSQTGDAEFLRKVAATAVERGTGRATRRVGQGFLISAWDAAAVSTSGPTGFDTNLEPYRKESAWLIGASYVASVAFLVGLAFTPPVIGLFAAMVGGTAATAAWLHLRPRVEVQPATRLRRTVTFAYRAVGAAILSGLASGIVKLLIQALFGGGNDSSP